MVLISAVISAIMTIISLLVAAFDAPANVKANADFVCTGVADEAVIIKAIKTLPATGGTIVLSEGTFTLSSTVSYDLPNVSLRGQGKATKLKYEPASGVAISVGGDNWLVGDFLISGNANAKSGALIGISRRSNITLVNIETSYGWDAIETDSGSQLRVMDVNIDQPRRSGIRVGGGQVDNFIENCRVTGAGGDGIYLAANSARTTVTGSSVTGGGAFAGSAGFHIQDSNQNRIIGCFASGVNGQGFLIDTSSGSARLNVIANCTSTGNLGDSGEGITIYAGAGGDAKFNAIIGCTCRNNATNQIEVYDTGGYNTVVGNYCEGPSAGLNGIFIGEGETKGSPNCVISGNTCRDNQRNGIQVQNSPNCIVKDNICIGNNRGNNVSVTEQNGITMNGASTGFLLVGNQAITTAGSRQKYGIRTENSAYGIVWVQGVAGNTPDAVRDSVGASAVVFDPAYGNYG